MGPADHETVATQDRVSVLLGTYLFRDLTPAELEPLARAARVRHFARGERIFDIGDAADHLYVMVSGEARDSIVSADGGELTNSLWGPGMIVGEPGFFAPDTTRVMALTAVDPVVLLTLARPDVMPFIERHPAAMRRALEGLAAHSRVLVVALAARSLRSLRERLLLRLLELAETNLPRADGSAVTPPVSQAVLSSMVGVTRENVNRALASLIAEGLVRAEAGAYVVTDRSRVWREVTGGPEVRRPNRRRIAEPG